MLFNSLQYLVFFPIVVGFYFALPYRFRWVFLLVSSYYFYICWKPEYIILIILSTLIDYGVALKIVSASTKRQKRRFLFASLFCNLGLLFVFKYFNFLSESIDQGLNHFNIFYTVPRLNVLLPVGISFYTFQTLSYTIDVYRGKRKPEGHLGIFAVYVSFFPQLVAGPIERSTHLLPQFLQKFRFNESRAVSGLKQIVRGLFKKVVIADTLAVLVDRVYSSPHEHAGSILIVATYFFAVQIYCDFSGYSDIAIGSARIMGFSLKENFRRPYFAVSISDFWKRWHISLSSWFKDYLYIPLGGNRRSKYHTFSNIFIVFLISGLWHGANWTFAVWGGLHGLFAVIERVVRNMNFSGLYKGHSKGSASNQYLRIFITFHLVLFAWIFFRANNLDDAFHIVNNLFNFSSETISIWDIYSVTELCLVLIFLCILSIYSFTKETGFIFSKGFPQTRIARYGFYCIIVNALIFLWTRNESFIYFQF